MKAATANSVTFKQSLNMTAGLNDHCWNSVETSAPAVGRVMGWWWWRGIRRPVTQALLFISRSRARECQHVPADVLSVAVSGCY